LDKRMSGVSSLLTYIGRLTLLNSIIIAAMPMFAMRTLKVPITIFLHF
jgi:hypothetical protein